MTLAAAPSSPGRGLGGDAFVTLLILAGVGLYAGTLASPYGLRVLTLAGCQALLVLGYQFIFGHAGALSLAQGAFFGLGAYTTAILGARYHWDFAATFPLSILVPLAIAGIVAIPTLRLASHYFALATLGLAQVALLVAVNAGDWTGGALGLTGVPGISFLGETVPRGLPLAALAWGVVAIGAWLAWRLAHGLTGIAYAVMRSDPIAASAIGLAQARLRFAAFLLSAAYAGAAGALQAHTIGVVSSETLEFSVMVTCLAMTVIGGSTRIAGALIGALLLTYLPEWLRFLEGHALLAYGAALLAMIVVAPEGIAGVLGWPLARWRGAALPTPLPVPLHASRSATLEARSVRKSFGGIVALDGVDLVVEPGEILGLIGPNGSGKTTLANVISGLVVPDDGVMRLGSRGLLRLSAATIARAGIARGFQTPALPPNLSALELVALARASATDSTGFLPSLFGRDAGGRRRRFEAEALDLLRRVGLAGEADRPCGALPAGLAWRVELARALALDPGLVILDEPAAGLGEREQQELGAILREISSRGIALLVIEHNMPFLLPTASRIVVLDQGRVIAKGRPADVVRDPAVIAAYLGREKIPGMSDSLLVIEGLGVTTRGAAALEDISIAVAEGEVVALLGANGAGKSTLLKAVMGLIPSRGAVRLGGVAITGLSPAQRARRGLGYVPEGRRLFPGMSVRDTLLVGTRRGGRNAAERLGGVLEMFPDLRPRLATPAWQLSGGQQQMLALGRALMSSPRLLLLDEPSLGLAPILVDELLARTRTLAAEGVGVLLAEQSVARALGVASRVYALAQGRIVAQGSAAELRHSPVLERAFLGADIALSSGRQNSQPEAQR